MATVRQAAVDWRNSVQVFVVYVTQEDELGTIDMFKQLEFVRQDLADTWKDLQVVHREMYAKFPDPIVPEDEVEAMEGGAYESRRKQIGIAMQAHTQYKKALSRVCIALEKADRDADQEAHIQAGAPTEEAREMAEAATEVQLRL